MDIEMVAARVFEGENETRSLLIEVEEAWRAYEIRLAFVSPAGRRYLTAPITLSGGAAVYALPAAVLDARGILLAQIVAAGENDQVVKSRVFRFEVERSIRCDEAAAPDGALITLGGVYEDVQSLWEMLENEYATLADIPVAVSELENDAGYISASEVESALSAVSEVPEISTDISADASSDVKTASPKAVKTYVDTSVAAIKPPKLGSCYVSADLKSGSSTAFEGTSIYYELAAGGYIAVYFQQDVPANATLEINGKGDVELYYGADEIGANVIKAGDTATFVCSIGQIVKYILVAVDRWGNDIDSISIPTVPTISTDISSDASSDTKTASPKAVKTYVDTSVAAIRPQKLGSCYVSADLKSGSSTAFEGTNIYYEPVSGGYIAVYFQQDVPANATLMINGKGDIGLYYGANKIGENVIKAGDTATFVCYSTSIVKYILVAVDRTVPEISTDISTDASSDTKTASPKAVKTYVDGQIQTVPVISTSISSDASSDTKTASPKAVKTYVDAAIGTAIGGSY